MILDGAVPFGEDGLLLARSLTGRLAGASTISNHPPGLENQGTTQSLFRAQPLRWDGCFA